MDVVALAQLGFPNAVATLGTACTAEHVQKLFRFTDSVVFSFDGDAAGRKAATRALEAALPHATDVRSIKFLFLPPEHDPDSYVREHGSEAFALCVSDAVPLSRQLIDTAREGCDLGTAEGRARMLAHAKPLWNALPEGALRQQLLGELAAIAGLNAPDLLDLWHGITPGAPGSRAAERAGSGAQSTGGERRYNRDRAPREGAYRGKWAAREADRPNYTSLKRPPPGPGEQAARLLLLHSEWWDRLTPEDHDILHDLEAPLGSLCGWLDRSVAEHGPLPWPALEQVLLDDPLQESARRLVAAVAPEDKLEFEDLRALLDRLIVERLKAEETLLIQSAAQDPGALQRWREVHARRLGLEARRPGASRESGA